MTTRFAPFLSTFAVVLLAASTLGLLSSCSEIARSPTTNPNTAASGNTPQPTAQGSGTSTPTTTPGPGTQLHMAARMPLTQTDCPAGGQARAAIFAPLDLGTQPALLYSYSNNAASMLKRYDVGTGKKTVLVSLLGNTMSNAQISSDGQFVLFSAQIAQHAAIQMVRVDGLGLQTLYCSPHVTGYINELHWSPDQRSAVFESPNPNGAPMAPLIQLLDLASGHVQTLLIPHSRMGYILRGWLTNDSVLMTGFASNSDTAPRNVYTFDIYSRSIQQVAAIEGYNWDISLTPDGNNLLLSQCDDGPDQSQTLPPSLISMQNASGGTLHMIYASHVYAVTQVRPATDQSLLFIIDNTSTAGKQAGLWKINMDGSGLTHLSSLGSALSANATTWSNVSRDGRFYAVAGGNTSDASLFYGPLDGGPVVKVATPSPGEEVTIIGWTTM